MVLYKLGTVQSPSQYQSEAVHKCQQLWPYTNFNYLTTNNSPSQDCTHLDNQTTGQMLTPFKYFTEYC